MTSHPTWVRGLKHEEKKHNDNEDVVAPYVGAWIETANNGNGDVFRKSHPTWVRGLKRLQSRARRSGMLRRTLRGCVD